MKRPRKSQTTITNLALAGLSLALSLLVLEFVLRLLLDVSETSYGVLFGHQVPPLAIVPKNASVLTDRSAPFGDLVFDDVSITIGDIQGYLREDKNTGYTVQESTVSVNGWWQSNELGARLRRETPVAIQPTDVRVLVFGDSFAHGTGLVQEDSWPDIIDVQMSGMEVVNLAVPGFGMGQAALRFLELRERIQYDIVVMMFVPGADLWRDINVLRHLGEEGWFLYLLLPRFILINDELTLVRSPYDSHGNFIDENRNELSHEANDYLSSYDQFYFPSKFNEPDSVLEKTILWRLGTKIYFDRKRSSIRNTLTDSSSEAMRISNKIFRMMRHYAETDGKKLILICLPSPRELQRLKGSAKFLITWKKMSSSVCETVESCIDLGPSMSDLPARLVDSSFDGGHYGPKANGWIAKTIAGHLLSYKKSTN